MIRPYVTAGIALLFAAGTLAAQPERFEPLITDGLRGWSLQETSEGSFRVSDGTLRVDGKAGWLRFDRQFQDFRLRLQLRFLTADADSGVFLRATGPSTFMRGWPTGSYQVQVRTPTTQSFLPPLGGLFRHGTPAGDTAFDRTIVDKLFRGLNEWHALEIEAIGESLVVRMEGQQILKAAILPASGYIGIQSEAGSVEYRQIEISAK